MSCLMIAQAAIHSGKDGKGFHVPFHVGVMNRREKCRSAVITIFLYQRKCFGKQPDTCPKLVFLPVILQSEVSLIVRVKILTGNAHRIGIGGSRITGKQEKVTGEDMRGAPCRYFHIADFLEVLTA